MNLPIIPLTMFWFIWLSSPGEHKLHVFQMKLIWNNLPTTAPVALQSLTDMDSTGPD